MRLRTTAGAYAGQIRDYAYSAGAAALRTGTAERVDEVVTSTTATSAGSSSVPPVAVVERHEPRETPVSRSARPTTHSAKHGSRPARGR